MYFLCSVCHRQVEETLSIIQCVRALQVYYTVWDTSDHMNTYDSSPVCVPDHVSTVRISLYTWWDSPSCTHFDISNISAFSFISLSECQDDAHLKNLLHPSYLIAVWHLEVESWVPFSIVLYEICNSPHTRHSSSMIIYNLYEKFAMNEQQSIFVQTSVTVQIFFSKYFWDFHVFTLYCSHLRQWYLTN